jgi:anaerobic selenocysteine-containing dehydrogenase
MWRSLEELDFFVNVDIFMTETCKYADLRGTTRNSTHYVQFFLCFCTLLDKISIIKPYYYLIISVEE